MLMLPPYAPTVRWLFAIRASDLSGFILLSPSEKVHVGYSFALVFSLLIPLGKECLGNRE
jgi:hypothetical protein